MDNINIMRVKRFGHINEIKQDLVTAFEIVDMGSINFYLSLKKERNGQNKILKLSQPIYIEKISAKYQLD